jgi:hypothetical protein
MAALSCQLPRPVFKSYQCVVAKVMFGRTTMRAFLAIALGAFLLLVTFADEVFAQRRGGIGRGGVGRGYVGRGYVGRGYVGRGIGYRGLAYRGVGYGYRPLARRAAIGAVGLGVGYGYYGGYYDGYYGYGDSCLVSRLVWNGWAYQRAWVRYC